MRREGREIILNYLAPAYLNFNNLKRRGKEERERERKEEETKCKYNMMVGDKEMEREGRKIAEIK